MEPSEIMERLSVFGHDRPVPREALAEAARQREAVTPLLLDTLDWLWENLQEMGDEVCDCPEYSQAWYAYFLLAQFREKRAYPKLIRLLTLDDELLDIALGDVIASMGNLLYSTFDGDLASAEAVAADDSLYPFARDAVLDLMTGLLRDGRMEREELVGFIRERLASLGDDVDDDEALFAATLANATADADLFELTEDFRQAFRQEKVDTVLLGDFDDFLDYLFKETRPEHQTRFMGDAAEELSDWACFEKDTKSPPTISEIMSWKVGRNDPCPCGSGKKYKKCCLRKLEEWELKVELHPDTEQDPYPPVNGQGGRPGLADFYSQDAITVDRLAYYALWRLKGPLFRERAEERQAKKQAKELLWEAFQETRRICAEQGLKTPEEFDDHYRVHYDCAQWLESLLKLLDNNDPRRQEVEEFCASDPPSPNAGETVLL